MNELKIFSGDFAVNQQFNGQKVTPLENFLTKVNEMDQYHQNFPSEGVVKQEKIEQHMKNVFLPPY